MKNNFELFFLTVDECISYMAKYVDKDYLELLTISLENIAFDEVSNLFEEQQVNHLSNVYQKLHDIDFNVEDIRRALEFLILKAFKEVGLGNIQTPNVLCLFIAYLVNRLNKDNKKTIKILDPLVGTGNLLYAISNNLEIETELSGIDLSKEILKLAQVSSEVLNKEVELFFQDTLSTVINDQDFIVFDTLNYQMNDDKFFPYELVKHHKNNLKDDGYMICITLDDFFNQNVDKDYKNDVFKGLSIVGVFELPKTLFVGQNKNVIVFKKTTKKMEKSLIVKMPNFDDVNEFNDTLVNIEKWFKSNI